MTQFLMDIALQVMGTLLVTVLTIAVPVIAMKILKVLNLQGDEKARAALESALQNGIAITAARLKVAQASGVTFTPEEEKQQLIAGAKAYAEPKVPDAIKRLGVADHLDEVIEARVAAPKPDATVALTGAGTAGTSP